jgi:hypothetical protein
MAVAGTADLNGDGIGDVLIGAPGEDPGASPDDAGRAYVFDGEDGALVHTLVSASEELFAQFGSAVSGIPDMNGDGLGDVAIGAAGEDTGSTEDAGRVYLFDGGSGVPLSIFESPNEEPFGFFGFAVSGVPDINGDGLGDVLVGAPFEDPVMGLEDAGRAYAFDGVNGAPLHTLVSPDGEEFGLFGFSVSGVDDMNGDGRGELAVGAPNEDPDASPEDAGRVYVFDGASGNLLATLTPAAEEAFGNFGWAVAGVPDVHGDALGEILVGDESDNLGGGSATLFDGDNRNVLHTVGSPGSTTGGGFGQAISGVPDMNRDGRGEFVIGAYQETEAGSPDSAGRVHLFDGVTGEILAILRSPNEQFGGLFGRSVAGLRNAGGDGLGDVIVGAMWEAPGASPNRAGRVYIFKGELPSTVENWRFYDP